MHAQGWFEASLLPCLESWSSALASLSRILKMNRSAKRPMTSEPASWPLRRARRLPQCSSSRQRLLGRTIGIQGAGHLPADAPIDVAPYLRERLFRRSTAVLLTSATLGAQRDVASFATTLGAEGAQTGSVSSPFDFAHNMGGLHRHRRPAPSRHSGRWTSDFWQMPWPTALWPSAVVRWSSLPAMRTCGRWRPAIDRYMRRPAGNC